MIRGMKFWVINKEAKWKFRFAELFSNHLIEIGGLIKKFGDM